VLVGEVCRLVGRCGAGGELGEVETRADPTEHGRSMRGCAQQRRILGGATARGSSGWLLAAALLSPKMGLACGGCWLEAESSLAAHVIVAELQGKGKAIRLCPLFDASRWIRR
jgi:hypothetical protein